MGKVLLLLLIILLAFASLAGYMFLSGMITDGERKIAEGQRRLEKGQPALEEGKYKLKAGKRELFEGKQEYEQSKDDLFLVLVDKLFQNGKGFKEARERISEGDKQVAKGEGEINVGEGQLNAGELALRLGREQVRLAKDARISCALGVVFFAVLSIMLGFYWRRALAQVLLHKKLLSEDGRSGI